MGCYYVKRNILEAESSVHVGGGSVGQHQSMSPRLLVLTSLAGGPKHGYALMEDIAAITGTRLGPGTLYGALTRLEKSGLIEGLEIGDRRRPYRLTSRGAAVLEEDLLRYQAVVCHGLARLSGVLS